MSGERLAVEIIGHHLIPTPGLILLSSSGDSTHCGIGFSDCLVKLVRQQMLLEAMKKDLRKVAGTYSCGVCGDIGDKSKMPIRKVLLADDNEINQLVGKETLQQRGCHVTVADNGMAGLEALQEECFEMVFMDCQVPVMDGYEATRQWRMVELEHFGRRLPLIALTANALAGDRENCIAAGMDDYLPKPFGLAELNEILEKWGQPVR